MKPTLETRKRELMKFLRQHYSGNPTQIDEFERTYAPAKAIWWYTTSLTKLCANMISISLSIYIIRFLKNTTNFSLHQKDLACVLIEGKASVTKNELEFVKVLMNSFLSTFTRTSTGNLYADVSAHSGSLLKRIVFQFKIIL
ncbi:unnamed protein product [Adineta ricciae]|uniref:Uncharacterized protein n=1 Tax=Adineta ricciae TaxID=249248 RepID=A0A815W264_ADIRI|nr:unnamed protein product [Adineta ricciae]